MFYLMKSNLINAKYKYKIESLKNRKEPLAVDS